MKNIEPNFSDCKVLNIPPSFEQQDLKVRLKGAYKSI